MRKRIGRKLLIGLPFLFFVACGPGGPSAKKKAQGSVLPAPDTFRVRVMEVIRTYPTDGTHGYYWPKEGDWKGTTRDLRYRGELLAEGDEQGRCHCSGLTFEVFFRAYRRWCRQTDRPFSIANMTPAELDRFRKLWFGTDGNKRTLVRAIRKKGLGRVIPDPERAKPGDFVQFWRRNGSGHSAVFMNWTRDGDGNRTGIRYWSSQGSTDGIDYNTESFGGEDGVDSDRIYIARIGKKN